MTKRPSLEDEIKDKSKASPTTKLVACIQITWFLAQLVGTWSQGLHTSILETFTLGVVSCSVFLLLQAEKATRRAYTDIAGDICRYSPYSSYRYSPLAI